MVVTALNPHIGYEKSAKIAMLAHKEGLEPQRGGPEARLRDRGAVRRVGASAGHDRGAALRQHL